MPEKSTVLRPFQTPLSEVSAQIDLVTSGLVEFRARSFYDAIKSGYPRTQRLPVFLVGEPVANQQYHIPAYRFFSGDGRCAIQLGPRMMSVNALSWDGGFEAYRETAFSIMDRYAEVMPDEMVTAYSIGFYNRIAVADLEEARAVYRLQIGDNRTLFDQLSYQSLHSSDAGLVLTQVAAAQPDERMNEKHLMVNNLIRNTINDNPQTVKDIIPDWRAWFEKAHIVAKDVFWNSLTPEAQKSWQETVPS